MKGPIFENSNILNLIQWIGWLTKLLSLITYVFFIRILLFDFHFPMPLRWKLVSIFLLSISIPAVSGALLFYGISSNHTSVQQNLARTHLESNLNLLELAYKEVTNRQVLNNLFFKSRLIKNSEIQSLQNFKIEPYNKFFGNNICSSFVYNLKGEYLSTLRYNTRAKIDKIKLTNCLYILNNISNLEDNSKTRKDKKTLTLAMGFAHKILGLFNFSGAAGAEGENIARVSDLNSLSISTIPVPGPKR